MGAIRELTDRGAQFLGLCLVFEIQEQPVVAGSEIDVSGNLPAVPPCGEAAGEGLLRLRRQHLTGSGINLPLGEGKYDSPYLNPGQNGKMRRGTPIERRELSQSVLADIVQKAKCVRRLSVVQHMTSARNDFGIPGWPAHIKPVIPYSYH